MLGLRILANDEELQAAIRHELECHEPEPKGRSDDRERMLAALQQKRRKLLDLHYADQITAETFSHEEARLAGQIEALHHDDAQLHAATQERDELSDRFEEVAALLGTLDIDAVWDAATTPERRVLVGGPGRRDTHPSRPTRGRDQRGSPAAGHARRGRPA